MTIDEEIRRAATSEGECTHYQFEVGNNGLTYVISNFLFRCDGIQTGRQRCNGAVGYQIQNESNAPPAIFAQQVPTGIVILDLEPYIKLSIN